MPTSRFVAISFNRPFSVARRILFSTGNVVRVVTALPTMLRPRFSWVWLQTIFMVAFLSSLGSAHSRDGSPIITYPSRGIQVPWAHGFTPGNGAGGARSRDGD